MLESLESETPNIKDMSVESTPAKKPKIDVASEIPIEYREEAFNLLEEWSYRDQMPVEKFLEVAFDFKIVFPKEFEQLQISDNAWQEIDQTLKDLNAKNDFQFYISTSNFKALFPEKVGDFSPRINALRRDASAWLNGEEFHNAMRSAKVTKLLAPQAIDESIFSDQDWETVKKWFEEDISRLLISGLALRLISPSVCDEIVAKLSDENIKDLVSTIKNKGNLEQRLLILEYAANLKAVLAKELIVTDEGLEIIEKEEKPVEADTSPFPETRNF